MPARALLVLLLGLTLAPTIRAEDDPTTVREGRWFRVVCHFDHERVADEALAAVEAIGPIARGLYGLREPGEEERLAVHLYRTIADYEAVDQELTGGRFQRNLAFAHHASKSAHVAVQPPVSEEVLDELGLPYLTGNLLAHEAAHLLRYRAMPSFRSHPMWVVDGAAIRLALQGELARGRIPGIESNPLSATEIGHGRRLLDGGSLPSVADLFHDRTDGLTFYERYACRWLFFEFLASGPYAEGFAKALKKLRQMGGGADFADRLEKRVVGATAPVEALEAAFHAWLGGLEPAWREVYRSLDLRDGAWVQTAFSTTNAIAWRTDPVGSNRYTLGGRVELLPSATLQMNVLLDKTKRGFVSIALRADGWLTLFEYDASRDHWNRRGSVEHAALKQKGPVAFLVRVESSRLSVFLEGQEAISVDLPDRTMDGPWGLGAQAGTCGVWYDIAVRPLEEGGAAED